MHHAAPRPFGLSQRDPSGLGHHHPFELSQHHPFGPSQHHPFGLSLSKPCPLRAPSPCGLSRHQPFGLSLSKPTRREGLASRGGRYPARAHAVAVGADAPTPLCCSGSGRAAELTALTAFASFKQAAASQLLKRAARAGPNPALLAAPEIAPTGYHPPRGQRLVRRGPFDRLRANGVGSVVRAVGALAPTAEPKPCRLPAHPGAAPTPAYPEGAPTAAGESR
jgi:hypothetical protein